MNDPVAGYLRFRREGFPGRAERFGDLAAGQQPPTLWIGCSDSRVVPELIVAAEPGEVFVVRTAGNVVPLYEAADAVAASIDYALGVLGVTDAVVCGHSGCGVMGALASGADVGHLPALATWLATLDRSGASGGDVDALTRRHVASQVARLAVYPAATGPLAEGRLRLHGWVFDVATAVVHALDPVTGSFAPPGD